LNEPTILSGLSTYLNLDRCCFDVSALIEYYEKEYYTDRGIHSMGPQTLLRAAMIAGSFMGINHALSKGATMYHGDIVEAARYGHTRIVERFGSKVTDSRLSAFEGYVYRLRTHNNEETRDLIRKT